MKQLLSTLCLSAFLAFSTARASTVLINENWNTYTITDGSAPSVTSQFVTNGGIWKAETGGASANIAAFSSSSSGKGLEIRPSSGSWVRIGTATGITLGTGLNGVRYDSQMARLDDLQAFTRMRIQTSYELANTTGYYLNITGTTLTLTRFIGGATTELREHTLESSLIAGTAYKFSLEVLSLDGMNTVNVYLNDAKVFSENDTDPSRLNFATNPLFFGFDSRRVSESNNAKAIYGDITITAVPEGQTTAFVLVGLAGLAGARWVTRRRVATGS